MKLTKSEAIGIIGTVSIHFLLILILIFFGFNKEKTTVNEGLTVNFGNINEAAGLFEPEGEAIEPEPIPAAEKESESENIKELVTQDQEKSISLTEKKKKEKALQLKKEEVLKKEKEERIQTEQKQKASAIRNQTASAFGTSNGKGASQGSSNTGSGNKGLPSGDLNSGNTNGGGAGYGHFSLNGRSINGGLPHPSYSIQEEGIVVVQITVSPKGNVIASSVALQGTNTDNSTLRSAALNAAKAAKFNSIEGSQNQSGTITYRFRLK